MTIMTIVTSPWFVIACCILFAMLCAFIESKRKPLEERLAPSPEKAQEAVKATVASIENPQFMDVAQPTMSKNRRRKNRRRKSHNPNG